LYFPEDKVMIVGDHLLPRITPHVGVYYSGPDNPLLDFLQSQEKVQQFDVELVLPAHGAVFKDHRYRAKQLFNTTNTASKRSKTSHRACTHSL
jgi:glyoxylase-like metal-dependent hydrolase (beta-lactamase superfamily II)